MQNCLQVVMHPKYMYTTFSSISIIALLPVKRNFWRATISQLGHAHIQNMTGLVHLQYVTGLVLMSTYNT
jgi:hypothetical protein